MTNDWRNYIMIGIACILIYLAIKKEFEPLLLLPIAFGMMMVNLYPAIMAEPTATANGGLFYYLYQGVKLGIYPPLIFLGIGAMTDFGPLIANPKSFLLGAAAQLGIFLTFIGAIFIGNLGIPNLSFTAQEAGAIAIIGGADGPTAIFVTSKLAPQLLGPIAVAAYSYMALVPIIQRPIMKASFEAGKDFVPDHRHHPDFPPAARCGNAGWHADAGQFDAREWRCFPYC